MSRKCPARNTRVLLALDLFIVAACVYYLTAAVTTNDGSQGVTAFLALITTIELIRYHYRDLLEAK